MNDLSCDTTPKVLIVASNSLCVGIVAPATPGEVDKDLITTQNQPNPQLWFGNPSGLKGLYEILKISLKKSAVITTLFMGRRRAHVCTFK